MFKKVSFFLVLSSLAGASNFNFPSFYGFLGVVNTPNAFVLKEGEIQYLYNNQVINLRPHSEPNLREIAKEQNYNLAFGFLPNLEISAQYSYAYKNGNSDNGYLSDRSLNFKYQLPFMQNIVKIAVGGQDIAGGAQHIKSFYVVATKEFKNFYASLGYAKGYNEGSLDGFFANTAFKPFDWLELGAEYDGREYNWVAKSALKTNILNIPTTFGFMYKNSFSYHKGYFASYVRFDFKHKAKFKIKPFIYKKFANHFLKEEHDSIYYSFENNLYSNSDAYAIKQVFASLSKQYLNKKRIFVTLKKANLPFMTLKANPKKYLQYLEQGGTNPIQLANLQKETTIKKSDWLKPYLKFTPSLILIDGSEYGSLDEVFALNTTLFSRFGGGFIGALNFYLPLRVTYNFKKGNVFSYRNRNKDKAVIDLALLNKYFIYHGKKFHWLNSFQAGLFDYKLSGVAWQSAFLSQDYKHMIELKLAYLKDNLYDMMYKYDNSKYRKEALLRYSYYLDKFNSEISLTLGKYLYGDKGIDVGFKRYFGDIIIKADFAYTKHPLRGTNKLGRLQIVIPLGKSNKDFRYANFSLGSFTYERKKTLVAKGGASYAQPMHLKEVDNDFTLENYFLKKGRNNLDYIKNY